MQVAGAIRLFVYLYILILLTMNCFATDMTLLIKDNTDEFVLVVTLLSIVVSKVTLIVWRTEVRSGIADNSLNY
jgi:hypothetical protein